MNVLQFKDFVPHVDRALRFIVSLASYLYNWHSLVVSDHLQNPPPMIYNVRKK